MIEPLKNEDIVRGLIVNADEYTEEKMIVLKKIEAVWINLENLQSAIEWLKREVVMCRDDDERTKYDIDKILELINGAFPNLRKFKKGEK